MPHRNAAQDDTATPMVDGRSFAPKKKIRVAVVDDHPFLCAGVSYSFSSEPDFEVIANGGSADDALKIARTLTPDVMLVDINMPGDIFSVLHELFEQFPSMKTVVLTAYDDDYYLGKALRNGASGYILKGVSSSELVERTRMVVEGALVIPHNVAGRLTSDMPDECSRAAIAGLTSREEEILLLVSHGCNNSEIGFELGIAEGTVKNHLSNIMQKLNLRNRVEAAMYAAGKVQRRRAEKVEAPDS